MTLREELAAAKIINTDKFQHQPILVTPIGFSLDFDFYQADAWYAFKFPNGKIINLSYGYASPYEESKAAQIYELYIDHKTIETFKTDYPEYFQVNYTLTDFIKDLSKKYFDYIGGATQRQLKFKEIK